MMKTQILAFWNKNKVFILGLFGALTIALQEFTDKEVNVKVIAFAALMACLSFLAKEWRGQGLSITGILGNAAWVFVTLHNNSTFNWQQFILQSIILIMTSAAPDPKSRGYENSSTILAAKQEGEQINPAPLTSKNK